MSAMNPIFHPTKPDQKILISLDNGAGWVTRATDKYRHRPDQQPPNYNEFLGWMLTYQPLIDFVETSISMRADLRNANTIDEWTQFRAERHRELQRIMDQFREEAKARFDEDNICTVGAEGICVVEVNGSFILREDDGAERVVELASLQNITLPS